MPDLTDRQKEIKTRLDEGLGAREIAEELGITRNAVYQQIQRLRKHGVLPSTYTPSGLPARELHPGADLLARLVSANGNGTPDAEVVGALALVEELRRVRDELDIITRRISMILPR